ncbi:GNAT family N-acetyltransferase [Prevotella sp. OH937_COT-195]|uniref:GNAT family N-acetyltransferase n=1 Tax=Prevotella sp. OH937_COT-195 TaxID=2491051 RepID=UPI000F64EB7A|nr:GNAT family N-acetyltransferase [Prevotella sp. OH937_COT-195]RRD02211.1 N-acetyltransferase [Prevotella sp. OH937_COT-195]
MTQGKIILRALEPEDLEDLYLIENDRNLWDVGITNVPYSRYSLREFIANTTNDIYADRQLRLVIDTEEERVAGIVDLFNFDPRHSRAEVGIVMKTALRGRGIAKETLAELHRYVAEVLDIFQLYAVVPSSNEKSLRLFISQGYETTATLRQWLSIGNGYQDALLLQKKIKK